MDSGGRFENNLNGPITDKIKFQGEYKFSIAFENDSSNGYLTEKLIQSFASRTIPIYWGDSKVSEYFNRSSFINVHDYSSLEEVVKLVIQLDNDHSKLYTILREPIMTDKQMKYHELLESSFRTFLFNIFDQPLDKAFRRSRILKGKEYNDELLRLHSLKKSIFYKIHLKFLSFVTKN